ncbi:3-hydroxyisobutyrate dehydrogenase and related beta-hydroxyacid dehydrogenase [Rubrobacter radiotolerans]|uniref:3-hydroxyisobutyrate dehydrogenase and related beta-hydroxyacid dehydrogenase n=1 Tax=Rubrobacter radiotolerans TaxID=42256 RepID=A0A023X3J0_RUBRA|nr:NAD(P)-dependent oxidoreductase [Rubrobacter radiotolerans]AHY46923.1 3-hydroxyisobutyrate dehydrogenase and related beta-hydroxyacid dehydrogenase [Rubrobacter radiotolerans]MDX5894328.1 NAD(P)-dependent oxidoreductase [Rubrobacter radiotolerans]SMC05743.1 2-hydroxy-3-oxopropionate reductase [Rubrobacter radiotolerans DSM 5868]
MTSAAAATHKSTDRPQVGFIGLGLMGYPMAKNLARAGYRLAVSNRSSQKAERLASETGAAAGTPEEVAKNSDVVFTMLPGPSEVEAVVRRALIPAARPGTTLVDMSTSSPPLARKLARLGSERGLGVLDAPVSGGDVGAIEGTLSIMVGGEAEDFERAKPLFDVLGKTVTHVGPAGAGQVVKAANQVVVALTIEAVSEALVLASRGGVAPEVVLDVLGGGLAANKVMEVKREKLLTGDFVAGGKVASQHKDLGIALQTARSLGVAMPATALVEKLYGSLMSHGLGDLDHSALLKVLEDLSPGR